MKNIPKSVRGKINTRQHFHMYPKADWHKLDTKLKELFLRQKLDLLINYLQKKDRWYTGTSIKNFLKKNVFSLRNLENPVIKAGRWSAYCHYSKKDSLNNLLEKNNVKANAKVLIHPLLPKELVDLLRQKKTQLLTLDITKDTLAWDSQHFQDFLDNYKVDIIINYNFNGLYKPLIEQIEILNSKIIPQITILNQPFITTKLLEFFSKQVLGGIIWHFGDSFWDNELAFFLPNSLQSQDWYVSWHFENRTSSILEYHLSKSQENYEALIFNYYKLILQKYKKLNKLKALFYDLLAKIAFRIPKKNNEDLSTEISRLYKQNIVFAVPDIVFDLEILNQKFVKEYLSTTKANDSKHTQIKTPFGPKAKTENSTETKDSLNLAHSYNFKGYLYNKLEEETWLQKQAENYYQTFSKQVHLRPSGTIEVPRFFLDQIYLEYFFYSTESDYWTQQYPQIKQLEIDPWVLKQNLPNSHFVYKYYLGLPTCT